MKVKLIFTALLFFSLNLHSEDIWIISPRITAIGGIGFASFDEEYIPNMWDVSGIKAGRVFDENGISQITLEIFGSSNSVITQDTTHYIYDTDTVESIRSFEIEEQDAGIADIFIHPKESFYFGAIFQIKEKWIIDTLLYPDWGLLNYHKKKSIYEGYVGWQKENLSLCVSLGSIETVGINQNSSSSDIEGSVAIMLSPSYHLGFVLGYANGIDKDNRLQWYGEIYTHEDEINYTYTKLYADWNRNQKSYFGIGLGLERAIVVAKPYAPSPSVHYDLNELFMLYSHIFKIKNFDINFIMSHFIRPWSWHGELIEEYSENGPSLESGIKWKERVICMKLDSDRDIHFGTEFPVYKIKIRAGYMYKGSMDDWEKLSPHIVSGGMGIPIGQKSIIDLVVKEMYGIYIGGASVRVNL